MQVVQKPTDALGGSWASPRFPDQRSVELKISAAKVELIPSDLQVSAAAYDALKLKFVKPIHTIPFITKP